MVYLTVTEYNLEHVLSDIYDDIEREYRDFNKTINILLSRGWKLQGGVSSIGTRSQAYLVQALTLDDDLVTDDIKWRLNLRD